MIANAQEEDGRHSVGGNKGPRIATDPGPATDFEAMGPLAVRQESIDPEALAAFYTAIRTQGNDATRQLAITNTLHRARANPDVTHLDYRLLEQIASRCRWAFRYDSEPQEATAFFIGQGSGSNMGRPMSRLQQVGLVAAIAVPRKAGGWPMMFCTIVCTAEDRSGQSWEMLRAQARERYNGVMRAKRNGCDWPLPDAPEPSTRHYDNSPTRHHDVSTVQNSDFEEGNSSPRRIATRHHEDQTVNSSTVKDEEDLVGESRSDVDATFPAPEIILPAEVLSPEPDATTVIREEHRAEFRQLADTFGRRPGEMIINPTPRSTTDLILDGIVRQELTSYLYDHDGRFSGAIAEQAIASALLAIRLMEGRSPKIGSMAKCFRKALRDEAAEIQRAEVNRIANLRVDGAIQQEIAEKRRRGVREGRGGARKSSSTSWSDLAANYAANQESR